MADGEDFSTTVADLDDHALVASAADAHKVVRQLRKKWERGQVDAHTVDQEAMHIRDALEVLRAERARRAAEDGDLADDDGTAGADRPLALAAGLLEELTRATKVGTPSRAAAGGEPPRRRRRVAAAAAPAHHPAPQNPLPCYQQYINGQFVASHSPDTIDVEDPATLDIVCRITAGDKQDAEDALRCAKEAQKSWKAVPVPTRAQYLKKIAALIRENRVRLARALACEQSKVISLAQVEIDFTAEYYDYYAGWARIYEGEVINSDKDNEHIYLHRQPLGVAVGIVPWNFPVFVMARKVAPSLLAGCSVVIKTASETPHACNEVAKLIAKVGLPPGVFNVCNGKGSRVGQALIDSPIPGILSLTGSVGTGVKVMQAAAKNLTKVSLELGGKAPAIVCADADIDLAVKAITTSRVIFSGQVCNCAERCYVEASVYPEFIAKMEKAFRAVTVGDPFDEPQPDMAALVNKDQVDKVEAMVQRAVAAGGRVLVGGSREPSKGKGYYFQPTLMVDCAKDSEIVKDEVFGPVLPVVKVSNLDEAIREANESEYGLTSSIFTRDINKAHRAMEELNFGETYVNREHFEAIQGFHAGWRKSGIGGADGKHGLMEYLNTHVMYVQYDKKAGSQASAPPPRGSVGGEAARQRILRRLSGQQ